MTDREYVIRACQMKRLDLLKPTKGNPGVVAYDMRNKNAHGVYPCIIEANNWQEARKQIDAHFKQ